MEEKNRETLSSEEKARLCAQTVAQYKAVEPVLLDVGGLSSFADYFLVCGGRSTRQVNSISERLEEDLRKRGVRPLGVEGRREAQWVLMDYGDVIVHIFYESVREFYDLESLWSEARRVRLENESRPATLESR
jgi:ribosome-associated protein